MVNVLDSFGLELLISSHTHDGKFSNVSTTGGIVPAMISWPFRGILEGFLPGKAVLFSGMFSVRAECLKEWLT